VPRDGPTLARSRARQRRPQLTVVGLGASAGGLEALEQFLGSVPKASGLAFVVLQHLDPTRPGLVPELLQRATEMEVVQAEDRAPSGRATSTSSRPARTSPARGSHTGRVP
jgi:chemotaxis response regulator CheB